MQRRNSDGSALVLPPPCFRKQPSTTAPAWANRSISALSNQSSLSDPFSSPSSSRSRGGAVGSRTNRSMSSRESPVIRSSSSASRETKIPMADEGRLEVLRETRSSSQGSLFSLGGGRRHTTADSLDSSITSNMQQPAPSLGYGCSRFLARLPPHPESLEFVQEEGNAPRSNDEGTAWPHMQLFRQDSWFKEDKIKDLWNQELKLMELKMKELLREEARPPFIPVSQGLARKGMKKRVLRGEKWNLRIGNQKMEERARAQHLRQVYDRLQKQSIAGGSLQTSGIPLQITQFNSSNALPPSSDESAFGPGHSQSPLLEIDQTLEDYLVTANHLRKRQRGDRVRSMQKAIFRPKSCTTESPEPQQRQDTDSPMRNRESTSSSAYCQQADAQSRASTPVWGNQISHQEQRRQAQQEEEEDYENAIPRANQSSIRQAADAVVEGIIGWASTFDSTKEQKTVEPDWHAEYFADNDKKQPGMRLLDPVIHTTPSTPIPSGGGDGEKMNEKLDALDGRLSSSFRRFRSRSPSATCNVPKKEAVRSISPSREDICSSTSSDGDGRRGSPFQFPRRYTATTSVSSRDVRHNDAVKASKSAEQNGPRSSSPVMTLKTILKPPASKNASSRTGAAEKTSTAIARTTESGYACPVSFDTRTYDDKIEGTLEKTRVSFGKDLSPLKRIRKKVRFIRCGAEKNDGVEAESIASISEMVDAFMDMTGCSAHLEGEYDEYSTSNSDDDSTDGQGSSIRTDGSLNDSLVSQHGITTKIRRSQSPTVDKIGEAFRAILEAPSKQYGTGAGLEAPPDSKEDLSSTAGSRTLRVLPSRFMRKVIDSNHAKTPASAISDPVILERENTGGLTADETLASLREIWSQMNDKTRDGSPRVDVAAQPSQHINHMAKLLADGPVIDKDLETYSVTLLSLGKTSPTMQGDHNLSSDPPEHRVDQNKKEISEAPRRQRSATRFMKHVLRRKPTQNDAVSLRRNDSKEAMAREGEGERDKKSGDAIDGRNIAIASTNSAIATTAAHKVPPPNEYCAKREQRQKRNPQNDDNAHDKKPLYNDGHGIPACHCMCNAFGNTPRSKVPDQVVCDNQYLSHQDFLAKKDRRGLDIAEDRYDVDEGQRTNSGLPATSNGSPFLLGRRGSFRKTSHQLQIVHQPQHDEDGSHSDDESVNQMLVDWLIESLSFGQGVNMTSVKGKEGNPMVSLLQCVAPPISSSTEDWVTTFTFCKVGPRSTRACDENCAIRDGEMRDVTMMRRKEDAKINYPPGYGVRDGNVIDRIPSDCSKPVSVKRTTSRRQKSHGTRKADRGFQPHSASSHAMPYRG